MNSHGRPGGAEKTTMTILVTGGAGYIGGHAVLALLDRGLSPIILDDLSTGASSFVPKSVPLVTGDIGDKKLVAEVIASNKIDTVLHFAAKVDVATSIADPLHYYLNNTIKAQSIIQVAVDSGVNNFIFSSTAAVYGRTDSALVDESTPLAPISPYGWSKLMTEQILRDAHAAHGLNYAILRYFNVAGADPRQRYGQVTRDATHLIAKALAATLGEKRSIEIYGDDYPTPDGTCVRDFIHVSDLADTHLLALDHLRRTRDSITLNCGYGRGYSVKEVLQAVEGVTGTVLEKCIAQRRIGDPVSLVADNRRLLALGWKPRFDNLPVIIEHAYNWQLTLARRSAAQDDKMRV
jgi:UDP-glucose 4-epimerase